jgi:hypothetical protein
MSFPLPITSMLLLLVAVRAKTNYPLLAGAFYK